MNLRKKISFPLNSIIYTVVNLFVKLYISFNMLRTVNSLKISIKKVEIKKGGDKRQNDSACALDTCCSVELFKNK